MTLGISAAGRDLQEEILALQSGKTLEERIEWAEIQILRLVRGMAALSGPLQIAGQALDEIFESHDD